MEWVIGSLIGVLGVVLLISGVKGTQGQVLQTLTGTGTNTKVTNAKTGIGNDIPVKIAPVTKGGPNQNVLQTSYQLPSSLYATPMQIASENSQTEA